MKLKISYNKKLNYNEYKRIQNLELKDDPVLIEEYKKYNYP